MLRLMFPEATPLKALLLFVALVACFFGAPVETSVGILYGVIDPLSAALIIGGGSALVKGGGAIYDRFFDPVNKQKRKIQASGLADIAAGKFKGLGRGEKEGMYGQGQRMLLGQTKKIESDLRRGTVGGAKGGGAAFKKLGELFRSRGEGAAKLLSSVAKADAARKAENKADAYARAGMQAPTGISSITDAIAGAAETGGNVYMKGRELEQDEAMRQAYLKAQGIPE